MTRQLDVVPDALLAAHERHLHRTDPWLGGVSLAGAGNQDGSSILLTVDGAAGVARRDTVSTADTVSLYGKLTRYQLQAVWGGDADALDELVGTWATWAHTHTPQPLDPETEASMRVPARDVSAGRVLLSHGLVPATTIAVRPAGRAALPSTPTDLTVRPATEADMPAILDLAVEEFHYESGLSVLTSRPNQRELLGPELRASLQTRHPWAWVAVAHDRPVGVLRMSPPGEAKWIGEVSPAATGRVSRSAERDRVAPWARGRLGLGRARPSTG